MATLSRLSKTGAFIQKPEHIPKYDIDVIAPTRVEDPHRIIHTAFPRPDADAVEQPFASGPDTPEEDREVGDYSPAERAEEQHRDPEYVENGRAAAAAADGDQENSESAMEEGEEEAVAGG